MKVVTAPDGARWRVGRRWLPWRPRLRKPHESLDLDTPGPEGCLEAGLDDFVVGIVAVIALVLFVLFVVPVLIALIELTLLVLLVAAGAVVRIVLRRPWIVDAVRLDAYGRYHWKVVGWRRSGEAIESVAMHLATGRPPEPDV